MPSSWGYGKKESLDFIKSKLSKGDRIIDIGAGCGTYFNLLKDLNFIMDAVEVWEPYIVKYKLSEKYRKVFNSNILDFIPEEKYDLAIMGDILEHLDVNESQIALKKIKEYSNMILVSVPYQLKQGAYRGVKYEIHKQSDLTNDIFLQRYPEFKLLWNNEKLGVYYWDNP